MPNDTTRVEIITSRERRRRYSTEQKLRLVEGGQVAVRADEDVVAVGRARELEQRVRELERLLGRKILEVEVLREALAAAREKARLAVTIAATGRFPVKVVADTLGIAQSNLVEQIKRTGKARGRYQRQGDDEVLGAIRQLTDVRPTYGYRRITALLNRARRAAGAEPVNHKRVFRLMSHAQLLLQPHVGLRPTRTHEGSVIAPASNQRWSSDGLEIGCWNGEVVRVAFAIDTHDREVMAWQAATTGISGEMIRNLMLACVEQRFGTCRAPHPVQWLADNGSAYTARETKNFAAALNLVACFTPIRSPESNGISEAFVKTLKRDYARIHPRPDALTVLDQLPGWIDDYNENHPHSGLRMRSPREFIRGQTQLAPCPV